MSLGLGAIVTSLVMAGFAVLFSSVASLEILQPAVVARERLVFDAPPSPPPSRSRFRTHAPALIMPAPVPMQDRAWPPLQPLMSAPGDSPLQDYLQERARGWAKALQDKVTGNDLKRKLGRVEDMPVLRDNQSFRTAGGDKVVRSGSGCAQIHTVQGSSSPTNHIDLAEPTGCPGGPSDQDEMGKALHDWAKKHSPPPP